MALTPGGTPYVEASDLVADYPATSLALAEHIDDLPSGLTHINTTTFTAQSTININSVFTSAYNNYKIIFERTANTAAAENIMRLRVGGVDNTGNSYSEGLVQVNMNTSVLAGVGIQAGTSWTVGSGQIATISRHFGILDIVSPFLTVTTKASLSYMLYTGNEFYSRTGSLIHDAETSFDGFSIIVASGTISGNIRVYGYQNS